MKATAVSERPASKSIFMDRKIRVISFFTNTIFTICPNAKSDIGLAELIEYSKFKMHDDLEGIVSDVIYFDNLSMKELLVEQQKQEIFATFVATGYSCYLTLNPIGVRIWQN